MSCSQSHLTAWRAVVTTHAAMTDRAQQALAAADLPPLSWFEILRAVRASPTGRPRMSELAEWLTLSRGGITKLVDRLQESGYITRVSCTEDRRSLFAELTPAGEKMLNEMQEVYEAEVERHLQYLTKADAKAITDALQKVTASTCSAAKAKASAAVPTTSRSAVREAPPVPIPAPSGLPLVGAGGVVRRGRAS